MAEDSRPLDHHATARAAPARVFYGWWIVLSSTFLMFVSAGISYYGIPVFMDPLQEQHGWSKSSLSFGVTWYFLVSGLAGPFIGRAVDRYGPKGVILIGGAVMAVALLAIGYLSSVWQLYAAYTLLSIGFSSMSMITVNALVTRWFIRKRARAMSIALTGVSAGGVILVPLTTYLIEAHGLRAATTALAFVPILVALPITLLVLRSRPEDLGLLPDGDGADAPPPEAAGALSYEFQTRAWTRGQAMRTVAFWAVTAAFVLALAGQTAFMMHQVSYLSGRIGTQEAAAALSITAGASIISRLIMGTVADRLDKRAVAVACFVAQGLGVMLVLATGNLLLIYLGVLIVGTTIGNVYMMQSLLVGECFGLASFGAIFGMVALFSQAGSAFGPLIAGAMYDALGSYEPALLLTALITMSASLAVLFARPAVAPPEAGGP